MDEQASAAIGHQEGDDDTEARGRSRRPLGSLPTLTGIFGLTCAHAAIQTLLSSAPPPTTKGLEDS
jgi:hypothetical protein